MATRIIYPALEDYQRKWRVYRVDKNLKDDWLVRLNNLKLFYVTSVCEGHFTCDDNYPTIVLFAKRDFIDSLKELFADKELLFSIFDGNFASDTEFTFSYTLGVSTNPNSIISATSCTPIKFSLHSKDPRESLLLDDKTSEWFEASVISIERIDEALYGRLEEICQ